MNDQEEPFSNTSLFGQNKSMDKIDLMVEEKMSNFEVPGLSLAIIKQGEIVYSNGFGTRTIGKNEPVDKDTLFAIGSISKSFTPVAVAMLVDEGKLDWDDKVDQYVPYFELYDSYTTKNFTIKDLLTHRSGLKWCSGGTLWYHSDKSRDEIIRGLKYLKPESEFRTKPAYQNITYLVASKVIEAVVEDTWDAFIRKRIFKPLGMNNTVILEEERKLKKNIATAHIKDKSRQIIPIEQEKLDNIAPAGSFYSTINDMTKYMNFILNDGIVGGVPLVSNKSFGELLTPQIHFPHFDKPLHNEFTSYGLCWWITPKNGNIIIEHPGSLDGMNANLMMEKNNKIGIITLSNSSYSSIVFAVTYAILGDLLKDGDYSKASQLMLHNDHKNDRMELARQKEIQESRIKNTKPSLALDKYTGVFTDAMYGDIHISIVGENLKLQFSHTPLFSGALIHWHYNTFELDWFDPRLPNGFITFEFDYKDRIIGFKIDQPNLRDVDFSELEITKKVVAKDR